MVCGRAWVLSLAVLSVACGAGRHAAWERTATPQTMSDLGDLRGPASLDRAAELWAERQDEAALRSAIVHWEAAARNSPEDPEIWVRLARAYYFLGDGHLSFAPEREADMVTAYEIAVDRAERALMALSPDFALRMQSGAQMADAIRILDEDAVPALYWRSAALGRWGIHRGFATVLGYKDEIRAVMQRCVELDGDYFHAGPHRYFGAFYARVPSFAGGDLERSQEHFDRALQTGPSYLGTRTLLAAEYAVRQGDRSLFEAHLQAVIDADVDAAPDVRPENLIEQRRARVLLALADDLFEE
ncbi:MAG: TRAP transporter TatT component family protein [Myxococcota bacterium]